MKTTVLWVLLLPALFLSVPSANAEEPTSAEALKQAYEARAALANKPVTDFERRYLEELEKLAKGAQGAGQLEKLLAIQKEMKEFRSGPAATLNQFPAVAKLRGIFDSRLPALEAKAVKGRSLALQLYIDGVGKLVTELTTAGKIDVAVEMNELKQKLTIELASLQTSGRSELGTAPVAVSDASSMFVAEVQTIPGLSGKSGRLRSAGTFTTGEVVIPPEAEKIDDFVRVYAYDRSWVGIREDGSAFIKYIRPIKRTVHIVEERSVDRISRGHDGWIVNRRDEFWRICEPDNVFDAPKTPDGIVGCHCAGIAFRADGMMETGGSQFAPNRKIPPPEGFFDGVVGACSGALTMLAVDPGGTLRGWQIDVGQPISFDGVSGVVEIESGRSHAIVRKGDGSIETFAIHNHANAWDPSMVVPADLGGTVARVRAGGQTSAIQRTDGSWLAWGPNPTVNDAVKSAGLAIDLDVYGQSNGYAIWIEPVE
jgi:hypothetical protein